MVKIANHSFKSQREHHGGGICYRGGQVQYDPELRWSSDIPSE
jgi:hypothetical protein